MNYAGIEPVNITNGPGLRVCLFVSGCRRHCKNCFNPETWDFNYGNHFDKEAKDKILKYLSEPHINGLTILGGEPMEKENQKDVANLIAEIRKKLPEKTIWVFTGYTFEELNDPAKNYTEYTKQILNNIDVLVDGPFIQEKKDLSLKFRGSSNQRLIDMNKTRNEGHIIIHEI